MRSFFMISPMKSLVLFMTTLVCFSSLAGQLDLRKLQYPVDSAKEEAKKPVPRFCAYLEDKNPAPRLAGLDAKQKKVVNDQLNIRVLNEYRLYDKADMDYEEKILLERYCTRYNRQLWNSLNLQVGAD